MAWFFYNVLDQFVPLAISIIASVIPFADSIRIMVQFSAELRKIDGLVMDMQQNTASDKRTLTNCSFTIQANKDLIKIRV